MKHRLTLLLVPLLLGALLAGCSDDDAIDPNASSTGNAIDREALLSNIEDVQAMIEDNAGSLDPMVVEDVDYSDGRLQIKLAESQNDLDPSGLESTCNDISEAIALPDMTVVVEKADGSESVECEFGS